MNTYANTMSKLMTVAPTTKDANVLKTFFVKLVAPVIYFCVMTIVGPGLGCSSALSTFNIRKINNVVNSVLANIFTAHFVANRRKTRKTLCNS